MRPASKIAPVDYGRYVVDITDGGIIIETSDGFSALTGYSDEDVLGGKMTFIDFVPDDMRDEYKKLLKLIGEGKIGAYLEHPFVCKDGSVMLVLCFGDEFVDGRGHNCTRITICSVSDRQELEEKVSTSRLEFETLMKNVPGGVAVYEIVGDKLVLLKANEEYYKLFGYDDPKKHPGFGGKGFFREEIADLTRDAADHIHSNEVFEKDVLFKRPDSEGVWIRLRSKFMGRSENGNFIICVVFIDITASKRIERQLQNQSERFRLIAENTDEIYYEYDIATDTLIFSNCINRYSEEDNRIPEYLSKEKYKYFVHPNDQDAIGGRFKEASVRTVRGNLTYRTRAFDDEYTWYKVIFVSVADDKGKVSTIFGRLFSAEHEQKLKSRIRSDKAEIERLLTTDQVTGLLTRKAFKEKVSQILAENYDPKACYAIVYSDINDFSYVNDNFGFEAGNQMLHDFGTSITKSPIFVTGSRIYSDFFASLIKGESRDAVINLIKDTNTHFHNEQRLLYPAADLHISTGLYFLPGPDTDITIAIDNADLARKSVKGVKEIPCGIYSERMRKQRSHEQQIAAELKNALLTGQIELFLQPKFSLDKREIIGAEALSRWRNPDGTYKLPYEFISVLEKVGYIVDLDMYIYETLLKTMARWKRLGYRMFPVSINFSRNHASHKNFVDRLCALAEFYGIEPSLVEIEITESAFMQDFNALYNDMKKLRDHGFKIDIDDFGMGYSSLSVLLYAPVDIVKVDKVFIDNIVSNTQARNYVNQICSLINLTNKSIVFEGVETEAQAQILADSGHKMAQGWLFDKAISVAEFEKKYMKPDIEFED